jgi:hypothetical protein
MDVLFLLCWMHTLPLEHFREYVPASSENKGLFFWEMESDDFVPGDVGERDWSVARERTCESTLDCRDYIDVYIVDTTTTS